MIVEIISIIAGTIVSSLSLLFGYLAQSNKLSTLTRLQIKNSSNEQIINYYKSLHCYSPHSRNMIIKEYNKRFRN